MIRLVENKTERDPAYHDFIYEKGKKIPKKKDNFTRLYLAPQTENGRMLKATYRVDIAGSVDGKYIETDECGYANGVPCFDGEDYNIWGIGENYVITSVKNDRFYIAPDKDNKKIVVHRNHDDKINAYTFLHKVYSMLI